MRITSDALDKVECEELNKAVEKAENNDRKTIRAEDF